ncbi:hypothetical protein DB346_06590 [Verrucomicrobia bacterium LW23]|nr:hypothetical protein DB346_06590 [Verrucomicrobia bacterium LW23]
MNTAFYILACGAVASAACAVRSPNVVYAILSLMAFFVSVAGLYVLLMAEFIAAAQVLVYVGPVVVLLLFALMLTPHVRGPGGAPGWERIESRGWMWGAAAAAGILFGILIPAAMTAVLPQQPAVDKLMPSTRQIGNSLMRPYTPALELMAVLLTAALIGAVVISTPRTPDEVEAEEKARQGLPPDSVPPPPGRRRRESRSAGGSG